MCVIFQIFFTKTEWQTHLFWKSQFVRLSLHHSCISYKLRGSLHLPLHFLLCWFIAFILGSHFLETSMFVHKRKCAIFWLPLHGLAFCSDLNKACISDIYDKNLYHPSYLLLITAESLMFLHYFSLSLMNKFGFIFWNSYLWKWTALKFLLKH